MEFRDMNTDELLARKSAIVEEVESEDADLDALESEVRGINEELEVRKADEAKKAEIRKAVADGAGEVIKSFEDVEERKTMTLAEVRASQEYIDAFAKYIKTGKDEECRSIITGNGTAGTNDGQVPVPEFVDGIINTAWDEMPILSRVTRTTFKGNVKIGFELSATPAAIHAEGADAPAEEILKLGIVELVPETIKKWITISDETLDLDSRAFVEYIYREISYRIFKKAEDEVVAKILAAPATATATAPAVAAITATQPAIGDIIDAEANLSDEATGLYVICTKSVEAAYKKLGLAANYAVDPFDGLTVLNNDTLGSTVIVGDLKGVTANFTNGTDVSFKYDDLSLAEKDLVKIVGRLPIAIEVTASGRFCKITQ